MSKPRPRKNYLTTAQLIQILEEKYGIHSHRATIAAEIELLKQFGLDIETVKSTQNKYHLVSREFDIAELKLLIDAVESSKFISAKKSEQLVAKISKFAGSPKGNELKRNIFPEGRIKLVNEQILLIVDAVNEAINSNKRIAFQYYQYNVRKEKKIKNDGDQYVFSPYYLVWNGDYYYMVGYSDKHKNIGSFRIDRVWQATQGSWNRRGSQAGGFRYKRIP